MAYQVSRADTGQFVLTDPRSGTVVIDEDLASGFDTLDRRVADESTGDDPQGDPATGPSVLATRGGSRATLIGLAVVLPFAWLAVFYFAVSNLLIEQALDREASKATKTKLEELEREVQALRSELAGAPRTDKTRANVRKPKPSVDAAADADEDEPDTDEPEPDEPEPEPDAGEPDPDAGEETPRRAALVEAEPR